MALPLALPPKTTFRLNENCGGGKPFSLLTLRDLLSTMAAIKLQEVGTSGCRDGDGGDNKDLAWCPN